MPVVSKSTWSMQIMPILRLIEPVYLLVVTFFLSISQRLSDCLKRTDPAANKQIIIIIIKTMNSLFL